MAKVRAFTVPGIEMWFYSGDHRPPHFHARSAGEWEVRVHFLNASGQMIEVIRPPDARIKGSVRKALEHGAEAHRAGLLREWELSQTA